MCLQLCHSTPRATSLAPLTLLRGLSQLRAHVSSLLLLQVTRICLCVLCSLALEHTQHQTRVQLFTSLLTLWLHYVDYLPVYRLLRDRVSAPTPHLALPVLPWRVPGGNTAVWVPAPFKEVWAVGWAVLGTLLLCLVYAASLCADYEELLPSWAPYHARYFTFTHALHVCVYVIRSDVL